MNVVDSSGWLEFLIAGTNGPAFRDTIRDAEALLVPSIVVFEVYRWMLRERGAEEAELAVATMSAGQLVELTLDLAIEAAQLADRHRLAMADSIILATARRFGATLWTQDRDFDGLDRVRYLPGPPTG